MWSSAIRWSFYMGFPGKSINKYHQTSNIKRTLVGNKIVGHSDVVGTSPVVSDVYTDGPILLKSTTKGVVFFISYNVL